MDRNSAPDPNYEDFSSLLQYNTIENKKLIDVKTEIPSSNAENNSVQELKFTRISPENLSASENTDGAGLENNEENEFISKPIYEDESSSEGLQISAVESESSVDFKTCRIENNTYQYSQDTVHSTKNLTVVETTRGICRKEEIIQEDGLPTENLPTKIEITEHGVSLENIEALENIYRDYSENVPDKNSKVNQKSVELLEYSVEKEKEPVKKTRGQKRKVQVNTADIYKNYSENVIDKSSKASQKSIETPEHNVEKEQRPVKKTRGRKKKVQTNTLDNFVSRTKNKIKTGPKENISIEKFEKLFIRLERIDISDKLHGISDNSKNLNIFTRSCAADNLGESSKPGAGKENILGINLPKVDETIVTLKRNKTKEGISKTETNLKTVAFQCFNCNKVMENDKCYRKHMGHCNNTVKLLKTYQEEFQCYHCNKVVTHRKSIVNHIIQCHSEGERRYHCDHCIYETNLITLLKSHMYKIHVPVDKKPIFKCKLCPHQTTNKGCLSRHVKRMHLRIIKMKKCDQCGWEGESGQLNVHIRKVHLGEEYFCNKCSFKTKTKAYLSVHQLKHKKIKDFSCPHCPFQTHYRKCLDEHIKTRHEYSIVCPGCSKIFKECALKRHIRRGHKEIVKAKCPECGKEVQLLRPHILTNLEARRKQKCPECSFTCVGSSYLRQHIKRYHEDKKGKTFTCYHCNKELADKPNLIVHLNKVHTVQKPCKCHVCGKMLKSKMYLNSHLMNVHMPKDKWLECDLCPEYNRFRTNKSSSLKWHRVRHLSKDEVTMYKCEYCPYETRVRPYLNKHVAKRHTKNAKKFNN